MFSISQQNFVTCSPLYFTIVVIDLSRKYALKFLIVLYAWVVLLVFIYSFISLSIFPYFFLLSILRTFNVAGRKIRSPQSQLRDNLAVIKEKAVAL